MLERKAEIAAPKLLSQQIEVAEQLPQFVKAKDYRMALIAKDCSDSVLDRVYPKAKTAPVQIEIGQMNTPAEIRIAIHEIATGMATGRIAPDVGDRALAGLRKALDAHRVQTFDIASAGEVQSTRARDQLADRLARAIEERRSNGNGQTAASPDPDASTDGSGERAPAAAAGEDEEIEITEEQLTEMAERAALDALRKRGFEV